LYPSLTWRVNTTERTLYLTFDDGPVPGPTEFVLDLLNKERVKATFFCIGHNIERHPAIFQRILSEGHAIGNHTYDHVNGWKLSTSDYDGEVSRCSALLEASGYTGRQLFRPPYGKITPGNIRSMSAYKIVMWDVLTYDFDQQVTPERCLAGALKSVRPGSIIVFHDSHKAGRNMMYALPRFLDECRRRGYDFQLLDTGP
jgi:peptidoglycan/xylan/chitin deacetylase (PgdA/CDA1 family)